jgi:hypothetical protein
MSTRTPHNRVNGHTNGQTNGQTNGHANGQPNGNTLKSKLTNEVAKVEQVKVEQVKVEVAKAKTKKTKSTETPVEQPTVSKPVEQPTVSKQVEQPTVSKPVEQPTEKPIEQPTETHDEQPVTQAAEQPTESKKKPKRTVKKTHDVLVKSILNLLKDKTKTTEKVKKPKKPKVTKAKTPKTKPATESKTPSDKPKSKRKYINKESNMDKTGISLGAARIKAVLVKVAINPEYYAAQKAIIAARNLPVKPKPTKEEPNPVMPPQGPQTPVNQIEAKHYEIVKQAEAEHENSLKEAYEKKQLDTLKTKNPTLKDKYMRERKAARAKEGDNFNLEKFNLSYDSKFYDEYSKFKEENDNYIIGKLYKNRDGKPIVKYNQWNRAYALVNKLYTRVSSETRNYIACFLDRIVEQYSKNAIHNCLQEGGKIVKVRHALTKSPDFYTRVTLDTFVSTFKCYGETTKWINDLLEVQTRNKDLKKTTTESKVSEPLPSCPVPANGSEFKGYINDICQSIRVKLIAAAETPEQKDLYYRFSISSNFKALCAGLVYEAILRIGALLKADIERDKVKTISDNVVKHVLHQLHLACGMDFEIIKSEIDHRITLHKKWREDNKSKQKNDEVDDEVNDDANEEANDEAEEVDAEDIDEAE